jgi:hypothetical protein
MEGTLVFNASAYGAVRQRNLITELEGTQNSTFYDGTVICSDGNGQVQQAHFANGTKSVRQATYCLVQSIDSAFWLGDKNGRWYPLD